MRWVAVGSLVWASSVVAGAFGVHGLASRIDEHALDLWQTGARYAIYGALLLCVVGLASRRSAVSAVLRAVPWLLLLGIGVFSGSLGAMALGAPSWLGAITPIGGLMLIVGALLFAFWAMRADSGSRM